MSITLVSVEVIGEVVLEVKRKPMRDGGMRLVKSWDTAYMKDYYEKNKGALKEKWRKDYAVNKDKIKARNRVSGAKFRKEHSEKIKQDHKTWRDSNKSTYKATTKKWIDNNPESIKLSRKKYKKSHKDEINVKRRLYRDLDHVIEKENAYARKRRKDICDGYVITLIKAKGLPVTEEVIACQIELIENHRLINIIKSKTQNDE